MIASLTSPRPGLYVTSLLMLGLCLPLTFGCGEQAGPSNGATDEPKEKEAPEEEISEPREVDVAQLKTRLANLQEQAATLLRQRPELPALGAAKRHARTLQQEAPEREGDLRREAGELVQALSEAIAQALPEALERAEHAWERVVELGQVEMEIAERRDAWLVAKEAYGALGAVNLTEFDLEPERRHLIEVRRAWTRGTVRYLDAWELYEEVREALSELTGRVEVGRAADELEMLQEDLESALAIFERAEAEMARVRSEEPAVPAEMVESALYATQARLAQVELEFLRERARYLELRAGEQITSNPVRANSYLVQARRVLDEAVSLAESMGLEETAASDEEGVSRLRSRISSFMRTVERYRDRQAWVHGLARLQRLIDRADERFADFAAWLAPTPEGRITDFRGVEAGLGRILEVVRDMYAAYADLELPALERVVQQQRARYERVHALVEALKEENTEEIKQLLRALTADALKPLAGVARAWLTLLEDPPGPTLVRVEPTGEPSDVRALMGGGEAVRGGEPPDDATVSEPFVLMKRPVTVGEYARFLDWLAAADQRQVTHPEQPAHKRSHIPRNFGEQRAAGEDLPVTGVDYWDAYAFARWLGGSLPTAAQWRLAAGELPDEAEFNHYEAGYGGVVSVHAYESEPRTGAQQMHGNVREWVASGPSPAAGVRYALTSPHGADEAEGALLLPGHFALAERAADVSSRALVLGADFYVPHAAARGYQAWLNRDHADARTGFRVAFPASELEEGAQSDEAEAPEAATPLPPRRDVSEPARTLEQPAAVAFMHEAGLMLEWPQQVVRECAATLGAQARTLHIRFTEEHEVTAAVCHVETVATDVAFDELSSRAEEQLVAPLSEAGWRKTLQAKVAEDEAGPWLRTRYALTHNEQDGAWLLETAVRTIADGDVLATLPRDQHRVVLLVTLERLDEVPSDETALYVTSAARNALLEGIRRQR